MTHRPYRVGMARPVQRYIEPVEIYGDLKRGPSTTMPDNFGYTWTPVNGLDNVAIDDVLKKIDASKGKKEEVIDVTVPSNQQLLDAVQRSAREGVVKEVKKNAPNLMLFAVAGGALGGVLAAKLGKTGTVLAIGLAVWSGMKLMNSGDSSEKK